MKRGTYVTQKDTHPGNIPVILGGQEPAYYCDSSNHEGKAIVISRSGTYAGFVSYWDEPIFVTDGFIIEATEGNDIRYIYHCLKNIQSELHKMKRGSGVPHVRGDAIMNIKIPVPCYESQVHLTTMLDHFEDLCNDIATGLPAEIEARQKQYEYYRDELLTFNKSTSNHYRET